MALTVARVLVIGGYGGFGGHISRRLAASGHMVLVAGRNAQRAHDFCAGKAGLQPLELDRDADLQAVLVAEHPDLVVDASGPFQGLDYQVPKACIEAGIPYTDIADGRAFVTGIGTLDQAARRAGVPVISGASSVPALSGAVLRELAAGMEDARAVEMAISASNRATAGASLARAILDYAGQPIRLWRGGRWQRAWGWQQMRRERFEIDGQPPLSPRLVALADVPDHDLVPTRLPGSPAVSFRAGTELDIQNIALWLASWLARVRLIPSLRPFARLFHPVQRMTAGAGTDRSGMIVRLFGIAGGQRVERRWTLIASDGDGPQIPALGVPLIVELMLAGLIEPGARDAGTALTLAEYDTAFAGLSIVHASETIAQPPPLYARIMGERFDRLPPAVRRMHDVLRDGGASGRATVTGADSLPGQLIARAFGFPPAGQHEVHVAFTERQGVETWTRSFSGRQFRSRLSQRGQWLTERFGPLTFAFDLPSDETGLNMALRAWWLGPLPLPLALAPRSAAREWEEDGRFRFDVPIAVPLVGRVVHYRGWLEPGNPARRHK